MLTFSINQDITTVVLKGTIADARPTTAKGREWWSEVWMKALEGRTEDTVDVDAYGYVCERNQDLANGKKETALLTVEELNGGLRGVVDTVASYLDANVDMIIDNSEIKTIVTDFLEMQEYLLIEEGVNLWAVFNHAKNEKVSSREYLRDIMTEYNLGDTISGVLTHPECIKILEGAIVC